MEKCVILLTVVVLFWTPLGQSAEETQAPDYCKLFPDDGPSSCLAYIPQFFYNSTSQKCDFFVYGGCGGNRNRFDSELICMETCHPQPVSGMMDVHQPVVRDPLPSSLPDRCHQPPESGPCVGYNPMFFFNATSNKCEIFIYGGCRGNSNQFISLRDCQKHCEPVSGLNSEVCKMVPDTGPCKAALPRLYYNFHSRRCEPFIYGGCLGTNNRFESNEECMKLCHPRGSNVILPPIVTPPEIEEKPNCSLPPEIGDCRGNAPSYFYNSTSRTCESFIYGGCGGNSNRFVSERECYLSCSPRDPKPTKTPGTQPDDQCRLLPDAGPCVASIPRLFYNHHTKECEEFSYGGCLGNQNNFYDREHCMRACEN